MQKDFRYLTRVETKLAKQLVILTDLTQHQAEQLLREKSWDELESSQVGFIPCFTVEVKRMVRAINELGKLEAPRL